MALTQYYAAASLDGYIARPDGGLDWLMGYGAGSGLDGPMSDGSYEAFYGGIGALVMGSATFEWILEHTKAWPYDKPSWVFTTRELRVPQGADVHMVRDDHAGVRDAAMEKARGKNVWMVGGGNIASQWADAGLLDELLVTTVPVVIGEGLPLFAGPVSGELRLRDTKRFPNGMLELAYEMPRRAEEP